METPRDKIIMILDRLGMSVKVAAKAMNIKEETFRRNRSGTDPRNYFNEKNYTDLLDFAISELEYLIAYSFTNSTNADHYSDAVSQIGRIFEEYPESKKKRGFSLFEELKAVVDGMEKGSVFSDMNLYAFLINDIVEKSSALENEPNAFTIKRYNNYVHSGKKSEHPRWISFINCRRQQAVHKILLRNISQQL